MHGCANYGYEGIEHLCTNSKASPIGSAVFFVSFVLIGTMVVLNLFIGVIMNSMDEMKAENEINLRLELKNNGTVDFENEIQVILGKIDTLKDELQVLGHLYRKEKDKNI